MFRGHSVPNKMAFYEMLNKNGSLRIWNSHSFSDGKEVESFRKELLNCSTQEDTLAFVWNGSECGCDFFNSQLDQFGLLGTSIFVEQGLLPQHKNIRFMLQPCAEEWNLSNKTENTGKPRYSWGEQKLTGKPRYNWKNPGHYKKGKICVIMQLSFDSSFYSLKNPCVTYPQIVSANLEEIYCKKVKDLEIVICPHPRIKSNTDKFDLSPFMGYRVSDKDTVEECADAELVIGYNSTVLIELALKGIPVKALWGRHATNYEGDLMGKVNRVQFDPEKITFKQLLLQRRALMIGNEFYSKIRKKWYGYK